MPVEPTENITTARQAPEEKPLPIRPLAEVQEEARKVHHSLRLGIKEGGWASLMVGFGESYLTAFGEFLKATALQLGLLTTLPQLLASLVQLSAFKLTILLATRKRIVLINAALQAAIWLVIIGVTYFTESVNALIILTAFYFIFATLGAPAWTSWMGDLVSENRRGRYFGQRNRIVGLFSFISITSAGLILDRLSQINTFLGFSVLFGAAFVSRVVSTVIITRQYEPRVELQEPEPYSFARFLRKLNRDPYGFFSLYITLMMFAVYLAAPLFVLYWLRILNFNYFQFTILISMSSVTSFITMTTWGRNADHFGNKTVLWGSSYLVAMVPFFWFALKYLPHEWAFLLGVVIQGITGVSWAGFGLSSANFIYDMVDQPYRIRFMSYHTAVKGIAIFLGGVLGSWLAEFEVNWKIVPSGVYGVILLSGIARLIVAGVFVEKIREVRVVPHRPHFIRFTTIMPVQGFYLESMIGLNRTVRRFKQRMRRMWRVMERQERALNAVPPAPPATPESERKND
ncbi:MAG: MFS transporter [Candidatus Marinimicrobia bacterium]|nr:MFS transporter [Candidatus Neomarinimicrobiota bacterium]